MTSAEDSPGRRDDVRGLADGLNNLAALSDVQLPLGDLLRRVARYAVQAIPGAEGAGLTLLEPDGTNTIVATADFVAAIDTIQYGLGQGPCIMAALEGRTVRSGSLGDDDRWGEFGQRIADLGVHSVVSLPLQHAGQVVGAMNVYARPHDVFDERAAELGERFAVPAAVAVQHAHVLEQAERFAEQLRGALEALKAVEMAIGVVMSRTGVDQVEARRQLEALSAQRGVELEDVARRLLDESARREGGLGPAAG